jgi:hypothetical protein
MVLFSKTTVRKHLDAHIRTIVVLTGGKLTRIYFSIIMHRRKGKKVSILPSGDVNPDPSPQDEVCLRTVPIMR